MAANAAIVAAAFAASRVLGLVREMVIAARFGTSDTYDAYVAAFRIPDLLFVIVMSGAFGSAFIPVFGGYLAQGDTERAWRLASALLTYTVVILLVAAQVILFLAEPLVSRVIAPELPPDSQRLAINLTRLLLLSPLLLGLGAAGKGILEAQDAFTLPAVAPILYNVGIILGALAPVALFGVYSLAAGVILGSAAFAGIQFAGIVRRGFEFRPILSRQTEGLADVARLMGPRIAGQGIGQINLIVMTNFASGLGEGRISALNYAQHLVMLPHGILAMSLSTVIFPLMARQYQAGQMADMKGTLQRALGPLVFLTLPAAIGLFAFRVSIVQVIFQFGSFSASSTALVAEAVGYFALGLLARAAGEALIRTFYAMRDTKTPLIVSTVAILANIPLSWMLASRLGHGGLALSLSITYTLRTFAMLVILFHRIGAPSAQFVRSLVRMLVASALMGAAALALADPLARFTDPTDGRTVWMFGGFAAALGGLAALYLVAAHALRIPEMARFVVMFQRGLERLR